VDAPLVLASASPRRAHILTSLRVPFRVVVPRIDESARSGEAPAAMAERLARDKAVSVAAREAAPVLAADTVVVCESAVLGKPESSAEAREMLRRLQGREHEVLTGVCVVNGDRVRSGLDRSRVRFVEMRDSEIDWYVSTGEPLDKAGAYHVDGLGALFIQEVVGSPSGIAGLPVRLLLELAREVGLDLDVASGASR